MNRERKNGRVRRQNGCRAVTLVDVQVHNRNATSAILGLHQAGSNRHVIEATKTLAPIGMGVMGAPGQIDAHSLDESDAGCCNRGTSGAPGTLHHFGRPRKPNSSLVRTIKVPVAKTANPVGVMCERQLPIRCGWRLK